MSLSFDYDLTCEPPAPVIEVTLLAQGDGHTSRSRLALIDSGADATILPRADLAAVGAVWVESREMFGVSGDPVVVDLYLLSARVGDIRIHGVRAVGLAAGREWILGRDVLRELRVLLDGPGETVELHE